MLATTALYAEGGSCPLPEPHSKIKHSAALAKDIVQVNSHIKTKDQVDHWMSCFSKSAALDARFDQEYREYIERAADAFDLPYTLLACLFFTESKWDRKATSGAGAVGLAQLMLGSTVPQINTLIAWKDQKQSLDDRLATHLKEMKRRKLGKNSDEYKQGMAALNAEYERNEARVRAKAGWSEYWDGKKAPKKLGEKDLQNAERSIAAGAIYLKYILLKYDLKSVSPLARLLLAAGAYNMGPNAMLDVHAAANGSYQGVLDRLRTAGNTETPDHMENIRNCMQNNIWKPGDDKDPRKCKPS